MALKFRSAKPRNWIIDCAQWLNAVDLLWRSRVQLGRHDLENLGRIPQDAGLIIASNHADEMDIKVCMEISKRSGRRFLYMINAEAFEEYLGWAGWWLRRLGGFSVERGGTDVRAKDYSVDVVKSGRDALVIFPEGEIHYLNDAVQPFKSGIVHIGMEALTEMRQTDPQWQVYILPVSLKYRYRDPVAHELDKRIQKMERTLFQKISHATFQERLLRLWAKRLRREDLLQKKDATSASFDALKEAIHQTRRSILARIESKYPAEGLSPPKQLKDRAQKLIFHLRERLSQKKFFSKETAKLLREDLEELKRVVHMEGWQPRYVDLHPSDERLAESVMKLERELYGTKRPKPLANRMVAVRIGEPILLGDFASAYAQDARRTAQELTDLLRQKIQEQVQPSASPLA
ncbi:MAG: lysophospholipid acyltransferase family protein [Candidatus Omnitrophota bacterium]